jgi:hypothetical protein
MFARLVMRLSIALLPILAGALSAQAPSPWAGLPVPSGVQATSVLSLGKVVAYREPSTVHAFSAVVRQWRSAPVAQTQLRWG